MAEWVASGFLITDERDRVDVERVHSFLSSQSYWAEGIPRELVLRSLDHSLCFSVFAGVEQVAFARVVTDYATFGYLADVFVVTEHRGRGVGKALLNVVTSHPRLSDLRRWMLVTRDAQSLYAACGFKTVAHPERTMEITRPGMYKAVQ